ncbi:VWA domain-containing protein [Pseudomonas sp. RIT-PI-S]|uniref:vWA domain-containing protein n=1 Tax=Pseudomonas sp. RIT-PI-S TaxID=3035295 RepID=UPI0021D8DCA7|nr:VWA domain-containing protein [Pseudomonas sp. RIT-PI-S]
MFEFAWPLIFLLLPLPWVARRLLPPANSGEQVLQVGFLEELATLSHRRTSGGLPGWRQQLPYAGVWLLLLVACARPQWLGPPLPLPASGRDLLVAVDVSGSMDYPDMQWQGENVSRLALVKHLLGDFLENRQGDRVGLILFGSRAYVQAPLTFDRHTVRAWLDDAQVGIAGQTTAIGDAIGLAVKRLRLRPAESRVLILVTDGANNGGQIQPLTAARLAAAEQVRIHTIGIGADPQAAGAAPNAALGLNAGSDLDETALQAIASATAGEYFRARDGQDLQGIGEALDRLEPVNQQPTRVRPVEELYHWPLAAAVIWVAILAGQRLLPPGRRFGWARPAPALRGHLARLRRRR